MNSALSLELCQQGQPMNPSKQASCTGHMAVGSLMTWDKPVNAVIRFCVNTYSFRALQLELCAYTVLSESSKHH